MKLTKMQLKNRHRITSWLHNREFQENARAKPSVPIILHDEIIRDYVPEYVQETGAYYTPPEMADAFGQIVRDNINGVYLELLDPCAGIGNLANGLSRAGFLLTCNKMSCYEIGEEAYMIGKKLYPTHRWAMGNAFDIAKVEEVKFDVVMMNPPFNIQFGTTAMREYCISGATKIEHGFLELAVRLSKPTAKIFVIAPYNYVEKMPKAFEQWLSNAGIDYTDMGELPGEFTFTKIKVHAWMFDKNHAEQTEPTPQEEQTTALPNNQILLEPEIFDALQRMSVTQGMSNMKFVCKMIGNKKAAGWVRSNPSDYGYCYYNGFYCTDGRSFHLG